MTISKTKRFGLLLVFLVAVLTLSGAVSALNVSIDKVELANQELLTSYSNNKLVKRDNNVEVEVFYSAFQDVQNAEVRATLYGYDHNDLIFAATENVDLLAGDYDSVSLDLKLPARMDQDRYTLWVSIADRTTKVEQNYLLRVSTERHNVVIKDVSVDPAYGVQAGRSLRALVNLKNYGEKDESDVKVEFEIPELGLQALPDYMDLSVEESRTSEELYIRIPSCTEPGLYQAVARVNYDDGDEVVEQKGTIEVLPSQSPVCGATPSTQPTQPVEPAQPAEPAQEGKVIVTVGAQAQEVKRGEGGAIYPITFTNTGSSTKTFVVSVVGAESWADVRISPLQTITVGAGESQSVYVYVAAKESASAGERMFTVDIKDSSGATVKQIPLSASVSDTEETSDGWSKLKKGLEIGLIVLIVLLVILALVIAFNRMKGDDEDEDEQEDEVTGQTYY
ncbi:MAG: FixG Ig-like domain-containing protein [Candidatus Nanoarchaeia archaeon]